jgi:hypothetical protein
MGKLPVDGILSRLLGDGSWITIRKINARKETLHGEL